MGKIKKKRNIVKELRQNKITGSIPINNKTDYNPEDIVYNDPTGKKISDTLLKYASPFIGGLKDDELKRMLMIVIMAWNISLLPKEQRMDQINSIFKDNTADNNQSYNKGIELMNYMIKCKEDLYAEYNYYIQDYKLTIIDDNPYLAVFSEEI
jgi:hypothetical protein